MCFCAPFCVLRKESLYRQRHKETIISKRLNNMNQRKLKTADEYSLTGSAVINHLQCDEQHENASRGAKDNHLTFAKPRPSVRITPDFFLFLSQLRLMSRLATDSCIISANYRAFRHVQTQ
jgi:hypothetical protein